MTKHAAAFSKEPPKPIEDIPSRLALEFDENDGLLPVRVNDGDDSWLIQEAAYPYYNGDVTFDEAVSEDLELYGVTVKVELVERPGIGGEPIVSLRGTFSSVKGWLAQYLGESYITEVTPEQIDTARAMIEEAAEQARRERELDY